MFRIWSTASTMIHQYEHQQRWGLNAPNVWKYLPIPWLQNSYIGKGILDFTRDQVLSKGHWGNPHNLNMKKQLCSTTKTLANGSYVFLPGGIRQNYGARWKRNAHWKYFCSCHLQIGVFSCVSSHFLGNFSSIIPESAPPFIFKSPLGASIPQLGSPKPSDLRMTVALLWAFWASGLLQGWPILSQRPVWQ